MVDTEVARKTQNILASSKYSDDEKLVLVFEEYKDMIEGTQLYYALLGWRNAHLKELRGVLGDE